MTPTGSAAPNPARRTPGGGGPAGLLILLGALSGCAAGEARGTASDSRVLTLDELESISVSTAWDVLEQLRPLWLRTTGPRSRSARLVTEVVVVTDGQYFGNLNSLRSIPAAGIREMRYLSGAEATNAYPGLASGRHVEAAIVILRGRTEP